MKLLVGLGNPGEKYRNTRHNMGFTVLDRLLEDLEPLSKTFWEPARLASESVAGRGGKNLALIKKINHEGTSIILMKPKTFMNNSGIAVKNISDYYRIFPSNIYVVHDDVDLPLGKLRVRFGGAAGGHKGVESIIQSLGTDQFLRIRLGIGRPIKVQSAKFKVQSDTSVEKYVLSEFGKGEKGAVRHMVKRAVESICLLLAHGVEKYMSKYHK